MKKILFLTATDNSLNNGNILCEKHRLTLLRNHGEISYLSLISNKKQSIQFLRDNGLSDIEVIEPFLFSLVRLIYKLNYIINIVFCNILKIIKNHYFFKLPIYKKQFAKFNIVFSFYIFPTLTLSLNKNPNYFILLDTNDILTDRHNLIGIRKWISISKKDEYIMKLYNVIPISISDNDDSHYKKLLNRDTFKLYFNIAPCKENIYNFNNIKKNKIGILASNSPLNRRDLKEVLEIIYKNNIFQTYIDKLKIGGSIINYATELGVKNDNLFYEEYDFIPKFYEDVLILIVPNGKSSGIKTKILEALNYGVNIITTQYGYDESLNIFDDHINVISHPIKLFELKDAIDDFILKESFNDTKTSLNSSLRSYNNLIEKQLEDIINITNIKV